MPTLTFRALAPLMAKPLFSVAVRLSRDAEIRLSATFMFLALR